MFHKKAWPRAGLITLGLLFGLASIGFCQTAQDINACKTKYRSCISSSTDLSSKHACVQTYNQCVKAVSPKGVTSMEGGIPTIPATPAK